MLVILSEGACPSRKDPENVSVTIPPRGILPMAYKFWVYIMASRSGTLYTGITDDIEVRVGQHKRGEIDGFAKKYRCTRLVYHEVYDHIHKTIDREKQIKGWRRSKKVALIEKVNPRWEDLAENGVRKWPLPASRYRENSKKQYVCHPERGRTAESKDPEDFSFVNCSFREFLRKKLGNCENAFCQHERP